MKNADSVSMENMIMEDKKKSDSIQTLPKLRKVFKRFCDRTSMHGCGQISFYSNICMRGIWTVLTLAVVGVLIFHLTMTFEDYYSWPHVTKVSLGFNNLPFPAITLCNVNVIKRNSLDQLGSKQLKEFARSVDPYALLGLRRARGFFDQTSSSNLNRTINQLRKRRFAENFDRLNLSEFDSDVFNMDLLDSEAVDIWDTDFDVEAKLMDVFRHLYMDTDKTAREAAGHDIEDMLISCSFNERMCFPDNFTLHQTSTYGNCYTLDKKKMVVRNPGPIDGLALTMYLETDHFLPGLTNGYGVRLVIHAPGTQPFPEDEGIFISSASETNIGLKQVSVNRLGKPYGRCDEGVDFKQRVGREYNQKICIEVCLLDHVVETCGCFYLKQENIAERLYKNVNVCHTTKERKCVNTAVSRMKKKTLDCKCSPSCSEIMYSKYVSSRQWPTAVYALLLQKTVCGKDDNCTSSDTFSTHSKLARSFVKLNIYYESLNYELITEEAKYDTYEFLSNIGGALGLWIGLSLLSLCEVLQLIAEVIICIGKKCRQTGKIIKDSK